MGLASTRMPYNAFVELARHSAPRAIQEEKTGSLTYWSAYHQISGPDQVPVAWLNIPYLSQQEVLDTRIRNFVSTLIQLYLLVLLVLGFLSLTFSRLLTQPLILLRLRMEKIRVGGTYEPIRYNSGDEIGDIIRSYNQMLVRLRESEESLAKTQRESAWKEMARQVAHEIKNPLTPMKLNIQHLIRAWNNRDENWDNLFSRVTKSLLSQIESLSEIAGAFSSFASMPKPTLRRIDLGEIIQNTVALYEQVTEAEMTVDLPNQAIPILADEDQLSRALQNLVKNALQSIENSPGFVKIIVLPQDSTVEVRVQDSGSGIPEEIQSKVFQPNFSTKTSGMGLGLAMVKRTVESVGGSIRFETQEGIGTTFILEFPLALETE
jgi:nitrogen fixation/metabolism regulation signal transduction histidine kinase